MTEKSKADKKKTSKDKIWELEEPPIAMDLPTIPLICSIKKILKGRSSNLEMRMPKFVGL